MDYPTGQIIATDATAILVVKAIKSACPWVPVYCQLISPLSRVRDSQHAWPPQYIPMHVLALTLPVRFIIGQNGTK